MRLTYIKYGQCQDDDRKWVIDGLHLGPINLLVGKNASGKSRTLAIINILAKLFSGDIKISFQSAHFNASFKDGLDVLHYELEVKNRQVIKEEFIVNAEVLMSRSVGGRGDIFAAKSVL